MPVYIAVSLRTDSLPLKRAVISTIESENRYELQHNAGWLISYAGTTIELCNHIGITGQPEGMASPVGSSIVVPITNYYGRAPADMWEWLKNKIES